MPIIFGLIMIVMGLVLITEDSVAQPRNANEYKLRTKLFTNYNKVARPQADKAVNVSIGVAFANLKSMDVKKEEMSFNIWFRLYWTDERLAWNQSAHHNIGQLRVLMHDMWTPSIFLYFATGKVNEFGKNIDGSLHFGAILYSSGLVFFSQPTTIHAACESDIAYYPFDEQVCDLTFGAWSQDITLIDMLFFKGGVDLSAYVTHSEWKILSINARKPPLNKYKSSRNGYAQVIYRVHLRRHALFYMVNYILPAVTIAILSLLVFLIPPEVGKRMEAGINLLLCLSVYLMLVNSKMPITSKSFPLLTKFYGCTIIILGISLCCSCWVYSYYFMNPSGWDVYHLPPFLQTALFDYLRPLLTLSCKRTATLMESSPVNSAKSDHETNGNYEARGPSHNNTVKTNNEPATTKDHTTDNLKSVGDAHDSDAGQDSKKDNAGFEPDHSDYKSDSKIDMRKQVQKTITANRVTEKPEQQEDSCEYEDLNSAFDNEDATTSSQEQNDNVTAQVGTSLASVECRIPSDGLSHSQLLQDSQFVYLANYSQQQQQKLVNDEKWKSAAMILNRLFIVLLSLSIVISFLACFMSSPRIQKSLN